MDRIDQTTRLLNPSDQAAHRQWERMVRKSAVAFARWASGMGMLKCRIAQLLGLRTRTLEAWSDTWNPDGPDRWGRGRGDRGAARGRPRHLTTPDQRALVRELIDHAGPSIGLPGLRDAFPHITYAELIEIRGGVRLSTREYQVLRWTCPGAVWAFDYTHPPVPVDACFRDVLVGRDLASGYQLLALPVVAATAAAVVDALDALFQLAGPPLVLKFDNGSQFIGGVTQRLLQHWQVTPLPSPPLTPRYNGSVEAGNASLKTHAHHRAVFHGRGDVWTADDLEAARMDANFTSRPWGASGHSPLQCWESRAPITAAQRTQFIHTVESVSEEARVDMGLPRTGSLGRAAQASVGRAAVRRALETLGLLFVTRRRFSPPFKS